MLKVMFEADIGTDVVSPINVAASLISRLDESRPPHLEEKLFDLDDLEEIARHLLTYVERVRAQEMREEARRNGDPRYR